ncbi:phage integrase SAM-like domain and Arm DNA-binding domain-containing protein [Dysgonomonas sp. ZJ279]|uniref:phage integrase SAM-like domain and Arm DNA-binding domain-containing protein n=1 Tax=Dysgonomonas sp. ZJ279 TaxID=2709796 RepID=UPI0013EDE0D1|nr:phage integrase SAM-like domain and Arm DNA-binding domain-containing protein [Dysgonomonas sp. ZJ279]
MKRNTFHVLFFVKRSRVAKNGESPVFMRITVNGQRIETVVTLSVEPDKWNNLAEKVIGKDRKSQEINSRLDTIRLRIMEIYRELEFDGVEINPRIILNRYQGREDESRKTLLFIFLDHNERCKKLIGKDMSPATVMRYETSYRHTAEFIQLNYKKDDVFLDEVNHQFIKDYEFFLKTERNCNHNSATKYLKNFKKIIRIALANEWIKKDPFANIRFTLDEVERDFLEDHGLQKIMDKKFQIERLAVIRDAFVFCCFTNLEDKKKRKANQGNELIIRNECPLMALSA